MLDLAFLGVGSAFCPQLGNTAAVFQRAGTLYLLDCGSLVFASLLRHHLPEQADSIVVLLTHTHADHAGSLGTLISWCKHVRPLPIHVVHPEESPGELLRLSGITPEQYILHSGMIYADDHVRVQFFHVPHTQAINAYSMLISDGEESVYYSGDAGDIPETVWQGFLKGNVARVYQDVSLHGKKGGSHGEYAWFAEHCPRPFKSRFYPIHLDEACRARALADGFARPTVLDECDTQLSADG